MISTAMSSHVQVFGWAYVFLSLGCTSRNGSRMTPVILRSGQDRWWCRPLRGGTLDENQFAGQEWGEDDVIFLRGVEFVSFEIFKWRCQWAVGYLRLELREGLWPRGTNMCYIGYNLQNHLKIVSRRACQMTHCSDL